MSSVPVVPVAPSATEDVSQLDDELREGGIDLTLDLPLLQGLDDGHVDWTASLGGGAVAALVRLEERRKQARNELERCWLPHR